MGEKMREDICYDDGMCAVSGAYERRARHCQKQGERGVSHDTPWLGFPGLQGIFLFSLHQLYSVWQLNKHTDIFVQ
jgi:hypothetical protein